jgi:hypothetical protein
MAVGISDITYEGLLVGGIVVGDIDGSRDGRIEGFAVDGMEVGISDITYEGLLVGEIDVGVKEGC